MLHTAATVADQLQYRPTFGRNYMTLQEQLSRCFLVGGESTRSEVTMSTSCPPEAASNLVRTMTPHQRAEVAQQLRSLALELGNLAVVSADIRDLYAKHALRYMDDIYTTLRGAKPPAAAMGRGLLYKVASALETYQPRQGDSLPPALRDNTLPQNLYAIATILNGNSGSGAAMPVVRTEREPLANIKEPEELRAHVKAFRSKIARDSKVDLLSAPNELANVWCCLELMHGETEERADIPPLPQRPWWVKSLDATGEFERCCRDELPTNPVDGKKLTARAVCEACREIMDSCETIAQAGRAASTDDESEHDNEDSPCGTGRPRIRIDYWAIGYDESGFWLFHKQLIRHGTRRQIVWEDREKVHIPKGNPTTIAKAFVDAGPSLSRADVLALFRDDYRDKKDKNLSKSVIKPAFAKLRRAIRTAIVRVLKSNARPKVIPDPIRWTGKVDNWQAVIGIGFAVRDDDGKVTFQSREEDEGYSK